MALLLLALVSALVPSSLGRPLTTSRALSEAGACAQVPGFDFYPGFDSPGGDTVLLPGSAYVLAMNCDAQQPLCQAFTSQGVVGYLKNAVLPRESWIPLKSSDPCQGLYVRQTTIINTPNAAASKCNPVFSYLSMADTDTVDDFSDLECADNANLKAATRKCSNDDTCRAFSISSAANRWCTKDAAGPTASTQDTCFYTKNLEVCPKIEGYTFTVNSDHRGSDLSCDNSLDPMSAAIKCSANQACAGFNLDYNAQHTCYKSSTINQVFNNQVCFYTKVNSVAAATCGTYNGLWVDLDTDHTGDDISCINPGSNLDAVAADCIANANCAAFSFNAASSQACTKSKATPVVQASGTCLFTKPTPPSGQRVLFGFAGAYAYNGNYKNPSLPAGTVPPVDPSTVPVVSGVETWVAIKTARDFYRDGAFFLGTDAPWDPATVIAAKQAGRRVSISFGGFSFPWEDPSNSATAMTWDKWQDNAVASIDTLVQSYHSDGIDIKYESAAPAATAADGTWVGFSDSWCSVFSRLKAAWPNLSITLSPATGTMAPYRKLYQACPQFISWVNWQAYADPAGFANQQASVNMAADAFGGIGNIAIGFVSDNSDVVTKRGTGDYSDAVALMSSFPDARGANIWQFENSVIRGYSLEQSLFPVLG